MFSYFIIYVQNYCGSIDPLALDLLDVETA